MSPEFAVIARIFRADNSVLSLRHRMLIVLISTSLFGKFPPAHLTGTIEVPGPRWWGAGA